MMDKSKIASSSQTLWQHPYVDVFKEFKILPISDWKQSKKQGSVQEVFVSLKLYLNSTGKRDRS